MPQAYLSHTSLVLTWVVFIIGNAMGEYNEASWSPKHFARGTNNTNNQHEV
jgi:hypothetical protein